MMPKTGMRGIRRQQFINAAISVILQDGLASISNARIASVAGLSPSLLPHYFNDRTLLLDTILRQILRRCHTNATELVNRHAGPSDQLHTLIDTHFRDDLFTPEMKRLCRDMHHATHQSDLLKSTYGAYQRHLLSVVRSQLRQLVSARSLDAASVGFIALLDGLWMKALNEPVLLHPADAASLQKQYLRMITTRIRVKAGDRLG
jgi:AcrR family transcriptional regulator